MIVEQGERLFAEGVGNLWRDHTRIVLTKLFVVAILRDQHVAARQSQRKNAADICIESETADGLAFGNRQGNAPDHFTIIGVEVHGLTIGPQPHCHLQALFHRQVQDVSVGRHIQLETALLLNVGAAKQGHHFVDQVQEDHQDGGDDAQATNGDQGCCQFVLEVTKLAT